MVVLLTFVIGILMGVGVFVAKDKIVDLPVIGQYVPLPKTQPLSPESLVDSPAPEKLLNQFNFEELSKRNFDQEKISLTEVMAVEDTFISYKFSYEVDGKTVTGMANVPKAEGKKYPVIVMLRGFVPMEIYDTGVGTKPSSRIYAKNGFITLAPDFLGYGGSDKPEDNVWWERFSKPVQVLQLLASIGSLEKADPDKIGLWGHSNGGQIALSVLEITGKPYPTTLWAPVTKSFPYSVLYFTDEAEDEGLSLRWELNRLEWDYDVRKFSISQYFDKISAPILLHQGTRDDAVPIEWSNEFVDRMKELEKNVTYHIYPGADHNLKGGWDTVVQRDVDFFRAKWI